MFTVRYVSDDIITDMDARVVGITEDPEDASARCFLFQRSLRDPDIQDQRLGLDAYAISNEQGLSAYRALENYSLDQSALVLGFTEEAAAMLGVPKVVALELALTEHELEVLDAGLKAILGF